MAAVTILAIRLSKRRNEAVKLQEILTQNGCLIKVRLGLHEAGNFCSEEGIVLLQITGTQKEIGSLISALKKIKVKVARMDI